MKVPDGAPFEGAFVQATNTKSHISLYVLSGTEGRYTVEEAPSGNYTLGIRAAGYKADPRTGLSLTADQRASADFVFARPWLIHGCKRRGFPASHNYSCCFLGRSAWARVASVSARGMLDAISAVFARARAGSGRYPLRVRM
jgi:Carboxypeptidase regulatory-like domain